MVLQASGSISMQDIVDEFGGAGSDSISEYYRGGTWVPNISANTGIPLSGTISFSDFYSATNFYLDTTLTIGNSGGSYGYLAGSFGSMASTTMSNSYTVSACYWDGSLLIFWISGASTPNTDATFTILETPGGNFARSGAFYNGSAGGGSFSEWSWTNGGVNPLGTSGTIAVKWHA